MDDNINAENMKKNKRPNFTVESVSLEALKYNTKTSFAKGNKSAYNFAVRNSVLERICQHMDHSYWKWSDEELKAEALKYSTKKEFLKGNGGAYTSANSRGLLKNITKHMSALWERKWDDASLRDEALRYTTIEEFYKFSKGAYSAACMEGILKEITSHMLKKKRNNWTESEVRSEASKYKIKKQFREENYKAYSAAQRLGILEDVCKDMLVTDNISTRALYAFEHSDKSVYVGLTWNYQIRYNQHMSNNQKLIEKKYLDQKFITFNEWFPANTIGEQERALIDKYRKEGWIILNKAKGGALGLGRVYWTVSKIQKEALKYERRVDFNKSSRGAYKAALRLKIIDQVCLHMPYRRFSQ